MLVSSRQVGVGPADPKTIDEVDPSRGLPGTMGFDTVNRLFVVYGKDGSTGRYLLAYDRKGHDLYGFDLKNFAWPPRIKPGDREFVYEQPEWAFETGGVLGDPPGAPRDIAVSDEPVGHLLRHPPDGTLPIASQHQLAHPAQARTPI